MAETDFIGVGRAVIAFDHGNCVLTTAEGHVEVIVIATNSDALTAIQDTLTPHLERSAPGDDSTIAWTPPVTGDDMQLIDPVVSDYVLAHCTPPDGAQRDLIIETQETTGEDAIMQISPDEGALLTMLTRLTSARFAIEVGVFTGYSSLCIARGLASNGRLLACDINSEWTAMAKRHWERAGVADRIDLRIGPALKTLRALPAEPTIDIAFVDADKINHPAYYEEIVPRLRRGGVIALDNVFLGGRVLDLAYGEDRHRAMRRLNDQIACDDRVTAVMLPVRDGLTVALRR